MALEHRDSLEVTPHIEEGRRPSDVGEHDGDRTRELRQDLLIQLTAPARVLPDPARLAVGGLPLPGVLVHFVITLRFFFWATNRSTLPRSSLLRMANESCGR